MRKELQAEARKFGQMAEEAAAGYLLAEGYTIRERNWRPRNSHLEVDIIAEKNLTLIFVEVKARTGTLTDPLDAVDDKKIRKLVRAARIYMASVAEPLDFRFDVITVIPAGNAETENEISDFARRFGPKLPPPSLITDEYILDHLPDAFLPPLGL